MKKIAFFRVFAAHPFLISLENMLRDSFAEYEVETITVTRLLKRRPGVLALNALHVVREYRQELRRDPAVFHTRFLRTPYLFRAVRSLVRQRLQKNREAYAFSFQWQSLFDLSLPGLPHFVYTDHTYQEGRRYAFQNSPYLDTWAALEGEIYRHASRVFTWSTNISRSLVNDYGIEAAKVVCAYTGSNILPGSMSSENREYSNKSILFVGSDWERKGGPTLAQAFKQVLAVHPDAELTVIGPSPQLDLPNTHQPGRVPLEQMDQFYRRASIFCLPTRREPFGNAFIDALQYGLPVVATRVGAVPDVVKPGENGCLVEPEDAAGLARALIELLDDPEKRRRFGEAGFSLWKERYTWENVGRIMRGAILPEVEPAPQAGGRFVPSETGPAVPVA